MSDTPNLPAAAGRTRQLTTVQNIQPLFDSAKFEQFQRAASALMNSSLLPESVRGSGPQACFSNLVLLSDFSDRWKIPLPALAMGVSLIHGRPMFEGKIISAALQGMLGLKLDHWWTGERGRDDYRIYVSDVPFSNFTDEQLEALRPDRYPRTARMIDGSVAEWRTREKDGKVKSIWTGSQTRNQLAYRGDREWCRLHEPGVIVGVYGEDEVDAYEARVEVIRSQPMPPERSIHLGFQGAPMATAQGGEPADVIDAETGEVIEDGGGEEGAQEAPGEASSAAAPETQEQDDTPPSDDGAQEEEAQEPEGESQAASVAPSAEEAKPTSDSATPASGASQEATSGSQRPSERQPAGETASAEPPAQEEPSFADLDDAIYALRSWEQIVEWLAALSKTKGFAELDGAGRRDRRRRAWLRAQELNCAPEPLANPTTLRCWMAATDDMVEIQDAWADFQGTSAYFDLTPNRQKALRQAIATDLAERAGA